MQLKPAPKGTYAEFVKDYEIALTQEHYPSILVQSKKMVPVIQITDNEVVVRLRLYLGIYIKSVYLLSTSRLSI